MYSDENKQYAPFGNYTTAFKSLFTGRILIGVHMFWQRWIQIQATHQQWTGTVTCMSRRLMAWDNVNHHLPNTLSRCHGWCDYIPYNIEICFRSECLYSADIKVKWEKWLPREQFQNSFFFKTNYTAVWWIWKYVVLSNRMRAKESILSSHFQILCFLICKSGGYSLGPCHRFVSGFQWALLFGLREGERGEGEKRKRETERYRQK